MVYTLVILDLEKEYDKVKKYAMRKGRDWSIWNVAYFAECGTVSVSVAERTLVLAWYNFKQNSGKGKIV